MPGSTGWHAKTVWNQEASSAVVWGHVTWLLLALVATAELVGVALRLAAQGIWPKGMRPKFSSDCSVGVSTVSVQ